MLKKFLLIMLITVFSFAAISGCKKSGENADKSGSAKLIVGTNAEFEPFEYFDGNKIVGFDIDLMNEIGKVIGKKIEFKNMAFDALLLSLQSQKIDAIISGMTATDDRRVHVAFTNPYFVSKQAIIIAEGTPVKVFEDLEGKNIGVVLGYTGDIAVTEKFKYNSKITRYNGTSEVIIALSSGKIDAAVIDMEPAKNYSAQNKGLVVLETALAEEEYSIALRKEDKQLLEEINKAIDTLKSNGTYDKLVAKYFN